MNGVQIPWLLLKYVAVNGHAQKLFGSINVLAVSLFLLL